MCGTAQSNRTYHRPSFHTYPQCPWPRWDNPGNSPRHVHNPIFACAGQVLQFNLVRPAPLLALTLLGAATQLNPSCPPRPSPQYTYNCFHATFFSQVCHQFWLLCLPVVAGIQQRNAHSFPSRPALSPRPCTCQWVLQSSLTWIVTVLFTIALFYTLLPNKTQSSI